MSEYKFEYVWICLNIHTHTCIYMYIQMHKLKLPEFYLGLGILKNHIGETYHETFLTFPGDHRDVAPTVGWVEFGKPEKDARVIQSS